MDLKYPIMVELDVTNQCNLRCIYCRANSGIKKENELSVEEFIQLIDEFISYKVNIIEISGGEPLLKKGISKLFRKLREFNGHWYLFTNGYYLTKNIISDLKRSNVDHIQITIAGVTPDMDCFHRRDPLGLAKSLQAIQRLKDEGIDVLLAFLITHKNLKQIRYLPEFLIKHHLNTVKLLTFSPVGRGKNHPELTLSRVDEEYLKASIKSPLFQNIRVFYQEEYESPHLIKCGAGKIGAAIGSEGKVYPCVLLLGSQLYGGNIATDSLYNIWNYSPVFKRCRVPRKFTSICNKCEFKTLCTGGCRARSYFTGGSIEDIDSRCLFSK